MFHHQPLGWWQLNIEEAKYFALFQISKCIALNMLLSLLRQFRFSSSCSTGVVCSYVFLGSAPPSTFYMFWPDEDTGNEWPYNVIVSYSKEE